MIKLEKVRLKIYYHVRYSMLDTIDELYGRNKRVNIQEEMYINFSLQPFIPLLEPEDIL